MKPYDEQSDIPFFLFVKKWEGTISDKELALLERWLGESPAHPAIAEDAHRAWIAADDFGAGETFDLDAEFAQIDHRIETNETSERPLKVTGLNRYRMLWTSAAAFILLVTAVTLFKKYNKNDLNWNTIVCSNSDKQLIVLPDSSFVWLRKGAKLEYPALFKNNNERLVKIFGEAYFQVKHIETCPFKVETEQAFITVLGTDFNVNAPAGAKETSVFLRRGKVQFESHDKQNIVILAPGEKVVFDHNSNHINIIPTADVNELSWQSGEMVFRHAPLNVVLDRLSHWYGKVYIVQNNVINNYTLTSTFREGSLKEASATLEQVLNLKLTDSGDTIFVNIADGIRNSGNK